MNHDWVTRQVARQHVDDLLREAEEARRVRSLNRSAKPAPQSPAGGRVARLRAALGLHRRPATMGAR